MRANDDLGISCVSLSKLFKAKNSHAPDINKGKRLKKESHNVFTHLHRHRLHLQAEKQSNKSIDIGQDGKRVQVRRRVKSRCKHSQLKLMRDDACELHEIAGNEDKTVANKSIETRNNKLKDLE